MQESSKACFTLEMSVNILVFITEPVYRGLIESILSFSLKGHSMGLNLPREMAKFGRPARVSTVST